MLEDGEHIGETPIQEKKAEAVAREIVAPEAEHTRNNFGDMSSYEHPVPVPVQTVTPVKEKLVTPNIVQA